MSATAAVAVIGAISTPLVAVAGYVFNQKRAARDRETTRNLAQDAHSHERQLAAQARAHERQMRQGERAYEDRKAAYRVVIEWALRTTQQVQLTEPILTTSGMPEPPDNLTEDQWRAMMIDVNLVGSSEVGEAMSAFREAAVDFSGRLMVWRTLREQRGTAQQMTDAHQAMQGAREAVGTAFEQLTELIRTELANL